MITLPEHLNIYEYRQDRDKIIHIEHILNDEAILLTVSKDSEQSLPGTIFTFENLDLSGKKSSNIPVSNFVTDKTQYYHDWFYEISPLSGNQFLTLLLLIHQFGFINLHSKLPALKQPRYSDEFLDELTARSFGLIVTKEQYRLFYDHYTNGFYPTHIYPEKPVPAHLSCYLEMPEVIRLTPEISLFDVFLERTCNGIYHPFPHKPLSFEKIVTFFNLKNAL